MLWIYCCKHQKNFVTTLMWVSLFSLNWEMSSWLNAPTVSITADITSCQTHYCNHINCASPTTDMTLPVQLLTWHCASPTTDMTLCQSHYWHDTTSPTTDMTLCQSHYSHHTVLVPLLTSHCASPRWVFSIPFFINLRPTCLHCDNCTCRTRVQ